MKDLVIQPNPHHSVVAPSFFWFHPTLGVDYEVTEHYPSEEYHLREACERSKGDGSKENAVDSDVEEERDGSLRLLSGRVQPRLFLSHPIGLEWEVGH